MLGCVCLDRRQARGPEYVRLVTECYKDAVVAYCNNEFTEEKIEVWNEKLASVFNRGFWDGYYLGQKLANGHTDTAQVLLNARCI